MGNCLILILGMAVVTYLPRLIPFCLLADLSLPPLLRRFLLFIPYTALGALIIPGAVQAVPSFPQAGLVGIIVAALCAWYKGGLILPVLVAVASTFIMIMAKGG